MLPYPVPLSNFDIDRLMAHYRPAWQGVFMRNEIPDLSGLDKPAGIVINLQDSRGPGTHWVALYSGPEADFYFDSFGLPPPQEIVEAGRGRRLFYSSGRIQSDDSKMCGYYAVIFLQQMIDGKTFYDSIYQWDQTPSANNEKMVRRMAALL